VFRKCPSCRSANVRRSSYHGLGALTKLGLFSPYRCRECNAHFRVVSRNIYVISAVIFAGLTGTAIVWIIYVAIYYSLPNIGPIGG
jgi:hypothetical protein